MEFSADTLLLNLIDLAKSGSKLIHVAGNVEYQCPSGDPQDPVTFTTRESHLVYEHTYNTVIFTKPLFSFQFFISEIELTFLYKV